MFFNLHSLETKKSKKFGSLTPTQALLGHFLMIKIKWSKFFIPNLDNWRLVNKIEILFKKLISICEPAIPSILWLEKYTCENCVSCFAHHNKIFLISINLTFNHQYNYISFLRIEMMASLTKTICPKNIITRFK